MPLARQNAFSRPLSKRAVFGGLFAISRFQRVRVLRSFLPSGKVSTALITLRLLGP